MTTQNDKQVNVKNSNDVMFTKVISISCVGFGCAILAIFFLINEEQPTAYMDEVFHVEQAQTYCKGNFSKWNSKITTPPGLYLTTLGFLKPFSELYAFGEDDETKICPIVMLRFMNVIFTCANIYLVFLINLQLHKFTPKTSKLMLFFSSLSLVTLPPLFFFSFLYYTDPGSLFFVLLMYLFHINNHEWFASLFGAISLLYRQTNIAWLFFLAAHTAFKLSLVSNDKSKRKPFFMKVIYSLPQIMTVCGGYALVGTCFVCFLIYNKGIVLGDRTAHEAVLHFAQIVYFLGFVAFFASPWIFTMNNIKKFIAYSIRYPLRIIIMCFIMVISINLSQPHPYLLADNRHYTFYLWKRLLGKKGFFPYSIIPIYLFTGITMLQLLHRKDAIWKCLFAFSIFISIVPHKLLELRYFIVPYVIWKLNIPPNNTTILTSELILYNIVNAFTIYMFIFYTFKWPNLNDVQRIMW